MAPVSAGQTGDRSEFPLGRSNCRSRSKTHEGSPQFISESSRVRHSFAAMKLEKAFLVYRACRSHARVQLNLAESAFVSRYILL